jgi:hypothetical protein
LLSRIVLEAVLGVDVAVPVVAVARVEDEVTGVVAAVDSVEAVPTAPL